MLRENQERAQDGDFRELKKKIKKREHKIDKLRLQVSALEKENKDLKVKVEEAYSKVQETRMKMEAKV